MNREPIQAAKAVFLTAGGLGGLLRAIMDESRQTRYAITQQAGLSESTLSRMYIGKRPATVETLVTVAKALGRRVVVRVE